MNILVTGGAGYIGSHTCKQLSATGHLPVVYDNLSAGHAAFVKWGPLVIGELSDARLLKKTMTEHSISGVLHFAGSAYVGESMLDPGKYFTNNVANTLNLLEAMRAIGVDKIVFSSTCAVYGVPETIPITEQSPPLPVNPYGESKLMIEKILKWYAQIHRFRTVCLRYFNAAGEDADGELWEMHNPETHLLPLAIRGINPKTPLHIFGTDYETPDGTAIRDFIHVADLADAHVIALRDIEQLSGGSFNLGTGKGTSVKDVINAVQAVFERQVNCIVSDRRAGDPPILVAKTERFESTGWKPRYAEFSSIVRTIKMNPFCPKP